MKRQALEWAVDPAAWARDNLGFEPDPWQIEVLQSAAKRKVYNCARQSGKSTVAAIKALHRAIYYPRSMVILLSPSQRQSSELFRKVTDLLTKMPEPPELLEDNKLSLTTANGSRVVSLPSNEKTIRGYSAVSLIIEDEAAAVPDEIFAAVRPMLAVSNGEYNMLSTPRGKRGHFFEAYQGGEWESVTITAAMNERISAEFLESERKELGSRLYSQEYECAFVEDQEGGVFKREWFADKLIDTIPKSLKLVRRWDRAATEAKPGTDPDYTAGCLMGTVNGQFYVLDMRHDRLTPKGNRDLIRMTAEMDGARTTIRMEQEPGSSGKDTIDDYARNVLQGYDFRGVPSTGNKRERAGPFSAACEAGNVYLVRGPWDWRGFIDELCAFPSEEVHDDRVDAASGAHYDLTLGSGGDPSRFLKYASR